MIQMPGLGPIVLRFIFIICKGILYNHTLHWGNLTYCLIGSDISCQQTWFIAHQMRSPQPTRDFLEWSKQCMMKTCNSYPPAAKSKTLFGFNSTKYIPIEVFLQIREHSAKSSVGGGNYMLRRTLLAFVETWRWTNWSTIFQDKSQLSFVEVGKVVGNGTRTTLTHILAQKCIYWEAHPCGQLWLLKKTVLS